MRRVSIVFVWIALVAVLFAPPLDSAVNILPTATATTTTADTGVITLDRRYVNVMVWVTAGTATVILEESDGDTGSNAPWVPIVTLTGCDSSGIDGGGNPCSYSTLTPKTRTRLRVSACSGCSVHRIIQDSLR